MKVGLIGIGFMGRGHLDQYIRLAKENSPVKLTAICDVDAEKFKGKFVPVEGNLDIGGHSYDFSPYALYTDYKEMLEKEELDYVDIVLPTYLHCEASVYALEHGVHVLCEKPMALTAEQCQKMITASEENGRKLMIGQCLRFYPAYEYLKECTADGRYGKALCAYFFRGGGTPKWSFEDWLLKKDKSGGCLLDQHIHDVDMINYLFGMPKGVSTSAVNVVPGSGYDAISTNYIYDGMAVNAQDDWTLLGSFGFEMIFRVNFEKASLIMDRKGVLTVNPNGGPSFSPELCPDDGYYREIVYFTDCIQNNKPITVADPHSTRDTIRIAECEQLSADKGSAVVMLDK